MKSSVKKLQAITLLLAFFLTSCNSATSPSNNQEKMSTPTPNKVIATSPKSIRKTTTQTPNRSISIHPESQEETITPTSNITITASPEPSVALIRKHLNCAGKMIAFVSDRDGNDEIYLMCDDGSQQTNISLHPAKDTNPIWSPDGSKLAFESIRNNPNFGECTIGCAGNIYIYDLSNLELNLISDIYGTDPSWSPDGSRIAFRHFYYGEDENLYSDIYLVNSDGSNLRNLTNHKSINFFPIWSPQADQILFFSDREFEYSYESFESSMYVADSDGSNLTNLVQTNHADASWSPDGTQVVFVDGRHSPATDIYVMSIDGTGLKQLTSSNRYE